MCGTCIVWLSVYLSVLALWIFEYSIVGCEITLFIFVTQPKHIWVIHVLAYF